MNRKLSNVLRLCVTTALILASYLISARTSLESPQTGKPVRARPPPRAQFVTVFGFCAAPCFRERR